jgi:hypothetical protein
MRASLDVQTSPNRSDSDRSLWSTLTVEERAFYASHAGPITYGPRAHRSAASAEYQVGAYLDVRG